MKKSKFEFKTPILLICFNREKYIYNQIDALKLVEPPLIYIYADGPRSSIPDDKLKTEKVREMYLQNITWDCDVKTRFQDRNYGCSLGPINAMNWFFGSEAEGIILEDDIIPSIDFFRFTQEMLEKYRTNKKIISISGCNFDYEGKIDGYLFCKIMNMWGWATWSDRFSNIEFSLESWKQKKFKSLFLYTRLKNHIYDFDISWWKYWKDIFDNTISTKDITWWDYQFIYNQLENRQLTVYPTKNLVSNIGFETSATHTKQADNPASTLKLRSIKFPLIENELIQNEHEFYENYLKPIWALYTRPNWRYYVRKICK